VEVMLGMPRRKRSRPAESAAKEKEAIKAEKAENALIKAERQAMRQAKALSKADVVIDEEETSICSYCERPCGNMGALKNHQRACPAKLVADAASATKEKKRSARNAAKAEQQEREEEEAAAQLHGPEGGATTPSLECGRCGRKCGNGGALARHVARCTAAALEGATALESSIVVRNATIEPGRARAVAPQRAYARADGPVAAWLSGVQGGRYISTFGDLICHHFEDLDELRALASLTRLGIDNVLARIGVDRAGVRLVLTHAVRQLPATA